MQTAPTHKKFFDRLYYNAYNHGKRNGQDVRITAHFTTGGNNKLVAKNENTGIIQQLRSMAAYYNPEKIMVIVQAGSDKKVYKGDFTGPGEGQDFTSNMQSGDRKIQEASNVNQFPEGLPAPIQPDMKGFQGFGQVSVEEYINKKLEDERKDQKLKGLETELSQRIEEISKLSAHIEKLENEIEESDKEKAELEGVIESKKNIRYWAGFTGDILESFGLKKEHLKEPLAGLIASENESGQKSLRETPNGEDQSGIVEDASTDNKRKELISLIRDYLQTVDNKTLADVFMIFSEIEQDNRLAAHILNYLNTKKQQEHANI